MLLYCCRHRDVTRSAFIILFASGETVAATGGKCLEVEAAISASSFMFSLAFYQRFYFSLFYYLLHVENCILT